MAKKYRVTLTAEERQELQAMLAKGKASARKLAHARVLLQVDETAAPGRTDEETASALNLSVRTVERVRERFVEQGLAVKDAKGNLPTEDAILDFSNPETVKWYQGHLADLLKMGVAVLRLRLLQPQA